MSSMSSMSGARLTGLSSEQMNVYHLKKSVECATTLWIKRDESLLQEASMCIDDVRRKFIDATVTFKNVIKSLEEQKDANMLQTILSEHVMSAYLHLALIFCNYEADQPLSKNTDDDNLSGEMVSVIEACLRCMDLNNNSDKLVDDFTEGAIFILGICIKIFSKNTYCKRMTDDAMISTFTINTLKFSCMYVNTLASMSRKYSNRKKIYTTFCHNLLDPCLTVLQYLESLQHTPSLVASYGNVIEEFVYALDMLMENSLFFDDKNVEDIATSFMTTVDIYSDKRSKESEASAEPLPRLLLQSNFLSKNNDVPPTKKATKQNKKYKVTDSSTSLKTSKDATPEMDAVLSAKNDSTNFKTSYHGGLFDMITSMCSMKIQNRGTVGCPYGIARLLRVYNKCSTRLLSSQQQESSNETRSRGIAQSKPSFTLQERRKHTIRVLQMALKLIAAVGNAYQDKLKDVLVKKENILDGEHPVIDDMDQSLLTELASMLLASIRNRKELLQYLSIAMDETGGSSMLATHDALQPFAEQLQSICNCSLQGICSSFDDFLLLGANEGTDTSVVAYQGEMKYLLLEAITTELDCVRLIAGIDHRAITAQTSSELCENSKSNVPSLVLQAIAFTGVINTNSFSLQSGALALQIKGDERSQHLYRSKEELLLFVISLFDDLRRMDDFVSEVRSVCQGGALYVQSFISLLGSNSIQDRLARAFAAISAAQSESVWSSLVRAPALPTSSQTFLYFDRSCQRMIVRALVQATTLNSAPSTGMNTIEGYPQLQVSISLSTPLPNGTVEAMSFLFSECVTTLQEIEDISKIPVREVDTDGTLKIVDETDDSRSGVTHDIVSMLLQLGSAGIVLSKKRKSSAPEMKEDLWIKFRETANATGALVSIQTPFIIDAADQKDSLYGAVTLISLSAFVATCDSLNTVVSTISEDVAIKTIDMDVMKSSNDIPSLKPLMSAEIDKYLLQMVTNASEYFMHAADELSETGSNSHRPLESGVKRKRKDLEAVMTRSVTTGPSPVDILLLLCRSVSVWQYSGVAPPLISSLTLAHFKMMAVAIQSDSGNDEVSTGHRELIGKHRYLCRLMESINVLDCPGLVRGFLMAIESVFEKCSSIYCIPSKASTKSRSKMDLSDVNSPLAAVMPYLIAPSITESKYALTKGISIPLVELLSASAGFVGDYSSSDDETNVIACIAYSAAEIISRLIVDTSLIIPSSQQMSLTRIKPNQNTSKSAPPLVDIDMKRRNVLEAASVVLHQCLRHCFYHHMSSPSSGKPASTSFTREETEATRSGQQLLNAAGSKEPKNKNWEAVVSYLYCILSPLLSSLKVHDEVMPTNSLYCFAPLLVDILLQSRIYNETISGVNRENAQYVLQTVSDTIIDILSSSRAGRKASILTWLVDIYRRVCSFYCALPAEMVASCRVTSATDKNPERITDIVKTLISHLLPYVQQQDVLSSSMIKISRQDYDSCCFLIVDSLRLYEKFTEDIEDDIEDLFLSAIGLPPLPVCETTSFSSQSILNGWFLLTGTILLLQRRSGNLLTIRGTFSLIESIKQGILLAASSQATNESKVDDLVDASVSKETLMCVSICLQGLLASTPYAVRSAVGSMLVKLGDLCACSPNSVGALSPFFNDVHEMSSSVSSTKLSHFAILGVDCLLSNGGQNNNSTESNEKETNSCLASAKAVLERIAVSSTSSTHMLTQPEVVLAVVSSLRRGIYTIQQQKQQRGRKKFKRMAGQGQHHSQNDANNIVEKDKGEEDSGKGGENALSQWAASCLSVLSKVIPRLLKGNGGMQNSDQLIDFCNGKSDRARVEISSHALSSLEQLFACDSVGGSSIPLLGNSIGTLGVLLTSAIRVIVSADEMIEEEKQNVRDNADSSNGSSSSSSMHGRRSKVDSSHITNALRVAGRTLTAASSSKELNRHAHVLAASIVDLLAQRPVSVNVRELLLPGLFALFDRCRKKQRLQMFATVNLQTRSVLSDFHGIYLRDFKFTGQ